MDIINFVKSSLANLFSRHHTLMSQPRSISKITTISYCNIRNFSTLCRLYQYTPNISVKLTERFVAHISSILQLYKGAIAIKTDDTPGWKASFEITNHQQQAVICSLLMINKMKAFNDELKKEFLPSINISIGLSSGSTIIDTTIDKSVISYNFSGDNVKFSKLLADKTALYKVSLIVCEEIANSLSNDFIVIELDKIANLFDLESVPIYTIIGDNTSIPAQHLVISHNHHNKFLRAYREQKWDIAISIANGLKNAWNNILKEYYLNMIEQCKFLKDNPPDQEWKNLYEHN